MHTSLLHAASSGSVDTVEVLIANGANVNSIDGEGKTPLIWAALTERAGVVQYLLDKGAKENIRDRFGLTAEEWGSSYG